MREKASAIFSGVKVSTAVEEDVEGDIVRSR